MNVTTRGRGLNMRGRSSASTTFLSLAQTLRRRHGAMMSPDLASSLYLDLTGHNPQDPHHQQDRHQSPFTWEP